MLKITSPPARKQKVKHNIFLKTIKTMVATQIPPSLQSGNIFQHIQESETESHRELCRFSFRVTNTIHNKPCRIHCRNPSATKHPATGSISQDSIHLVVVKLCYCLWHVHINIESSDLGNKHRMKTQFRRIRHCKVNFGIRIGRRASSAQTIIKPNM